MGAKIMASPGMFSAVGMIAAIAPVDSATNDSPSTAAYVIKSYAYLKQNKINVK